MFYLLYPLKPKVETWIGLVPDIFNSLARHLNFTFTLALSRLENKQSLSLIVQHRQSILVMIIITLFRDGAWGSKNARGEWSGIIRCRHIRIMIMPLSASYHHPPIWQGPHWRCSWHSCRPSVCNKIQGWGNLNPVFYLFSTSNRKKFQHHIRNFL